MSYNMNLNSAEKEYRTCTPEDPFKEGYAGRWAHPQAVEIDEDYGKGGGVADGDFVKYRCPVCGKEFWVELPN